MSGDAWLAPEHQRGLTDFWQVYDADYERIVAELLGIARLHPELGPIVRAMQAHELAEHNRVSRELLRNAI
jgi:hypothetical protein